MNSLGQFQVAERVVEPAADVLAVGLDAFFAQPVGDLEVGNRHCARAFRNRFRIGNMIAVSVADQDKITLHRIGGRARRRVAGEERVNENLVAAGLDRACHVRTRCI